MDRVQHHEVRELIAVFGGDRGGVNQNVAGIFRALKGILNVLGLLIGHRAQVMHRLVSTLLVSATGEPYAGCDYSRHALTDMTAIR